MNKKTIIICFDVDLTLITEDGFPIYDNINLLIALSKLENTEVHIWSGGGQDYALHWGMKLGLDEYVHGFWLKCFDSANRLNPDLTFDDQEVELGEINIQI